MEHGLFIFLTNLDPTLTTATPAVAVAAADAGDTEEARVQAAGPGELATHD